MTQVFGEDKKLILNNQLNSKRREQRIEELAQPKDKWKRGKILLELKKKFPHDIVLERMIREEFKENRTFKYPEEYDLYDDEQDKQCKHMTDHAIKKKDLSAGKVLREKFKQLDDQELYYLKREVNEQRRIEREMDQFIFDKAV